MSKLFSEILAQCLDDIKSGRAGIEECMERYPAFREELEPLLKLAVNIQPPEVEPTNEFRADTRAALINRITKLPAPVTKPRAHRLNKQNQGFHPFRRLKMIPAIISIVLAVSMAGGGTAYAAQSSLPGDALYNVKMATEELGLAFTFGDSAKTEQNLVLAQRRIQEAESLMNQNRPSDIPEAGRQYRNTMERLEVILGNGPEGVDTTISDRVAEATGQHLLELNNILGLVPDEAKSGIENAINASIKGQTRALEALAPADPVGSTERYLGNMDKLLNQLENMAGEGNPAVSQVAGELEELENFGATISEIAHGLGTGESTVDELLEAAHAIHLEVLNRVYDMVPEQAKEAIDRARQNIPGSGNGNPGPPSDLPVKPPGNTESGDSGNGNNSGNPDPTDPPVTTQPGPPVEAPLPTPA